MRKKRLETDITSITHRGITFQFFLASNTKEPTLVFQMLQKDKGISLSIGVDTILATEITRVMQKRIAEM